MGGGRYLDGDILFQLPAECGPRQAGVVSRTSVDGARCSGRCALAADLFAAAAA